VPSAFTTVDSTGSGSTLIGAPVPDVQIAATAQTREPGTPPPDEDVTPGIEGFLATFFIAACALLLARDMVRRIRRMRAKEMMRSPYPITERGDSDTHRNTGEAQHGTGAEPVAGDPQSGAGDSQHRESETQRRTGEASQ
jgi:hypothetical protein